MRAALVVAALAGAHALKVSTDATAPAAQLRLRTLTRLSGGTTATDLVAADKEGGTERYVLQSRQYAYEFSERADATFNATSTSMKVCAAGFLLHSAMQAAGVLLHTWYERDVWTLFELGGCLDELAYAYFVHQASGYFRAIASSRGHDVENLMDGIKAQRRLWRKMQKPLIVKSLTMFMHMVWRVYSHAKHNDASMEAVLKPVLLPLIRGKLEPLGVRI